MVEPFSIGALGMLAAAEGIRFLYGQATEVLTRWRARKKGEDEKAGAPIADDGAQVLERPLQQPEPDFAAVERLSDDIKQLASVLGDYASGLEEPDPDDEELMAAADALRRALEVVYGQRMTFKDEQRAADGPEITGIADVDRVLGDVAGVRARLVKSGRIKGKLRAGTVEAGATGAGVTIDTVE